MKIGQKTKLCFNCMKLIIYLKICTKYRKTILCECWAKRDNQTTTAQINFLNPSPVRQSLRVKFKVRSTIEFSIEKLLPSRLLDGWMAWLLDYWITGPACRQAGCWIVRMKRYLQITITRINDSTNQLFYFSPITVTSSEIQITE